MSSSIFYFSLISSVGEWRARDIEIPLVNLILWSKKCIVPRDRARQTDFKNQGIIPRNRFWALWRPRKACKFLRVFNFWVSATAATSGFGVWDPDFWNSSSRSTKCSIKSFYDKTSKLPKLFPQHNISICHSKQFILTAFIYCHFFLERTKYFFNTIKNTLQKRRCLSFEFVL